MKQQTLTTMVLVMLALSFGLTAKAATAADILFDLNTRKTKSERMIADAEDMEAKAKDLRSQAHDLATRALSDDEVVTLVGSLNFPCLVHAEMMGSHLTISLADLKGNTLPSRSNVGTFNAGMRGDVTWVRTTNYDLSFWWISGTSQVRQLQFNDPKSPIFCSLN